eukprot:Amastigsp_a508486_77.p4 type:complete len:118 gc:universal Amastigsp_a508486_77:1106-1459(+)
MARHRRRPGVQRRARGPRRLHCVARSSTLRLQRGVDRSKRARGCGLLAHCSAPLVEEQNRDAHGHARDCDERREALSDPSKLPKDSSEPLLVRVEPRRPVRAYVRARADHEKKHQKQ